jgi:hypothetical protein
MFCAVQTVSEKILDSSVCHIVEYKQNPCSEIAERPNRFLGAERRFYEETEPIQLFKTGLMGKFYFSNL